MVSMEPPGRLGRSNMLLGDDPRCDPRLLSFLAESRHDQRPLNPHLSASTPLDERIASLSLSEIKLSALFERCATSAPDQVEGSVTRSTEAIAGELPTGKEGDPNKDGTYIMLHISRPATGTVTYLDKDMPCIYFIHGGMLGMGASDGRFYSRVRDEIAVRVKAAVVGIEYRKSAGKKGERKATASSSAERKGEAGGSAAGASSEGGGEHHFPFPDGLNDCIKGLLWVNSHRQALGVGPKIVVCADCGGANLALAMAIHLHRARDGPARANVPRSVPGEENVGASDLKQKKKDESIFDFSRQLDRGTHQLRNRVANAATEESFAEEEQDIGVTCEEAPALKPKYRALRENISGLYVMCPFIYGCYDNHLKVLLSLVENDQYIYSREQLVLLASLYDPAKQHQYNPLCWPYHADPKEDLAGFPPTRLVLHELDPCRDEGLGFYRKLLKAGVTGASCSTLHGLCHGGDLLAMGWSYEDVFASAMEDLAAFVKRAPLLMEPEQAKGKYGKAHLATSKVANGGGGGRLPGGRWDW